MSRILIVDDSSDLLNILNWSLQRKGYTCAMACYRAGLFYKLSRFTPALIILDVDLNGEDGRKICMEIKQSPPTKNVPVILCSGRHDLLHNFQAWLADDFIEKPFEIKTVVTKIENLFNKQQVIFPSSNSAN